MIAALGFDSSVPFTTELLQQAQAKYGKVYWVGRYLGTGGGAAVPLTTSEVSLIMDAGIGLLPIFNDSVIDGGTVGTYAIGKQDSATAVSQAESLGIPANVYLAVDVEYSANVSGAWHEGWADGMRPTNYAGVGIEYCAPLSPHFMASIQAANAGNNPNVKRLLFWSATPEPGLAPGATAPPYTPDVPSGFPPSSVVAWQLREGALGDKIDLDLCNPAMLQTQSLGQFMLPPGGVKFPKTVDADLVSQAIAILRKAIE